VQKSLGRIAGWLGDADDPNEFCRAFAVRASTEILRNKTPDRRPIQARSGKAQTSFHFRFVTSLDEVLCQPVCDIGQRSERNMSDDRRNCPAEFSDLYVRLLRAALDEANGSLSPRIRERRLADHVIREVSLTCMTHESLRLRGAFNRGSENGEEPLL
jgi:hypothetical protein